MFIAGIVRIPGDTKYSLGQYNLQKFWVKFVRLMGLLFGNINLQIFSSFQFTINEATIEANSELNAQ
jgi:hypothetical protein